MNWGICMGRIIYKRDLMTGELIREKHSCFFLEVQFNSIIVIPRSIK